MMISNTQRFTLLILTFVVSLLVLGVVGYRAIEPHWSFAEAFYMTVITISTVGFGEIRPLTPAGRMFTVALIFFGLFAISIIGAHAARLLIDSELKKVLGRKRMKKEIAGLKDHYIVCGYGRIGSTICAELSEAGIIFVILEKDEELIEQADKEGYCVLKGDATSDTMLREVGIEKASGVIAALNSDAHNLFISLAAREMNPHIKIIARGEEPGIERRLLRAGANVVVSPLKLGGRQIARMILDKEHSSDQKNILNQLTLTLQQVQPEDDLSKTVDELLHQANAMLAVAIRRSDGQTDMMPDGEDVLSPRDTLYVCNAAPA